MNSSAAVCARVSVAVLFHRCCDFEYSILYIYWDVDVCYDTAVTSVW